MALSDTGLIVRYYIEEAASEAAPTELVDSSTNSYNLTTINYGSGNLAYTEINGDRGLECTSTTGSQRAVRAINNTSDAVRDALVGATAATIELVVRVDSFDGNGGRIFGVNNGAGGNGNFIVSGTSATTWRLAMSTTTVGTLAAGEVMETWNGGSGARAVFHIVVDSTKDSADDRVIVYKDGSAITSTVATTMDKDATITLESNVQLIAFNRENNFAYDRSFDGVLFYAAMYNAAFSSTRVTDHYTILAESAAKGRMMLLGVG